MKHNRRSSGKPQSPIDLTSLLDVIFIVLFAVILYCAKLTKAVQMQVDSEQTENSSTIEALENENFTLKAKEKTIEELNEQYSSISEKVLIVQIHCESKAGTPGERSLIIQAPDEEIINTTFDRDTKEETYDLIYQKLKEYIEDNNSGEDMKVVVLSINTTNILAGDMEKISSIVNDLINTYENVY